MREDVSTREEDVRAAALRALRILDTPPEPVFDELTRSAALLAGTPFALISLIDDHRQWFKSAHGLAAPLDTPLTPSLFCAHVVRSREFLEVEDALQDARFHDSPLVSGPPGLRFYAGTPLVTAEGTVVGSLCVMGPQPRTLAAGVRDALGGMARVVMQLMELRRAALDGHSYRLWIEQSSQAAVIADAVLPDFPVVFVNEAFTRLTGYRAAEVLGRNCRFLQGNEGHQGALVPLREALAQGRPGRFRLRNQRRDGSSFLNELDIYPVCIPGQGCSHVVGLLADVTQRVAEESALRRSEARFRSLTALSSDWYWEQDDQLRYAFVSARSSGPGPDCAPRLGLTRWEQPGVDLGSAPFEAHAAACMARHPFRDLVYRWVDPAGTVRWLSESGEPFFDDAGGFLGFRGICRDVTADVRSREELRAHRDNLQALVAERTRSLRLAADEALGAARAKSEFLANMSHELRTPMHAILSFAELARDRLSVPGADLERVRSHLARIHESGKRLLALLNDLLDLSKLEAGKMAYRLQPTDLAVVATAVADEFQALAASHALSLAVTRGEGGTVAWCDPDRTAQVLRNLVSNAVKFTPDGGRVTVHVGGNAAEAGFLRVDVRDSGVGIPESERETIFDQFVQGSLTRSGAGGTGLGLTICRETIAQQGGRIWAGPNPGGGACLSFELPRPPAA